MVGSALPPIQSSELNKKYLRLEHTRPVITTQTFMLLRSTFSTGVPVLFLLGLRLDFPSNTAQPTGRVPPEIADRLEIRFATEMVNALKMEIERDPARCYGRGS